MGWGGGAGSGKDWKPSQGPHPLPKGDAGDGQEGVELEGEEQGGGGGEGGSRKGEEGEGRGAQRSREQTTNGETRACEPTAAERRWRRKQGW